MDTLFAEMYGHAVAEIFGNVVPVKPKDTLFAENYGNVVPVGSMDRLFAEVDEHAVLVFPEISGNTVSMRPMYTLFAEVSGYGVNR